MINFLLIVAQNSASLIPQQDLSAASFKPRLLPSQPSEEDDGTQFLHAIFERSEPSSSFSVQVTLHDRPRPGDKVDNGDRARSLPMPGKPLNPFASQSFSGIPIGFDQGGSVDAAGLGLEASTLYETIQVGIMHRSGFRNGQNQWPDTDVEAEKDSSKR